MINVIQSIPNRLWCTAAVTDGTECTMAGGISDTISSFIKRLRSFAIDTLKFSS